MEPLIEQLVERGRLEDASGGSNAGMTAGLEAALTEKQETEAKLAQAELRISQLEAAMQSGGGSPSKVSPPAMYVGGKPGGGPGPPPPPGGVREHVTYSSHTYLLPKCHNAFTKKSYCF